ncbi:hypothetical protein G7054_g6714 [Neopestalotiopsis clavispora]|nr:hypothetical protein G7054_g6714 [Neopestalotiopsis clavispora]
MPTTPVLNLEIPLVRVDIIVTPVDTQSRSFDIEWLIFECLDCYGVPTNFSVRDIDDPKISDLMRVPFISEVEVHLEAIRPSKTQIIYQWVKLQDVSWILKNLEQSHQRTMQIYDDEWGARDAFWARPFHMDVAGSSIQVACNYYSLVTMALIMPLLSPLRDSHYPDQYQNTNLVSPLICGRFPSPDVADLRRFCNYIHNAIDELDGIQANFLRRERFRLQLTSRRSCLCVSSEESLLRGAMRLVLDPDTREVSRDVQSCRDNLPKLEISPEELMPCEKAQLLERWGEDSWADRYPHGIPPLGPLVERLGLGNSEHLSGHAPEPVEILTLPRPEALVGIGAWAENETLARDPVLTLD